jgi:hypothetical protein
MGEKSNFEMKHLSDEEFTFYCLKYRRCPGTFICGNNRLVKIPCLYGIYVDGDEEVFTVVKAIDIVSHNEKYFIITEDGNLLHCTDMVNPTVTRQQLHAHLNKCL